MVTVKAIFDGKRVILPDDFRGVVGTGEVTVVFPDDMLDRAASPRPSICDVINRVQPTGRTVEDVNRQIREDRAGWDDH